MMKEAEVDAMGKCQGSTSPISRMMPVEVGDGKKEEVDMNGYDQLMYTQNVETIEHALMS